MKEKQTSSYDVGKQRMKEFAFKQSWDYETKKNYAHLRAREFYNECGIRGLNVHISCGGLDSITLLLFLRSIYIDVPAISVSSLEDKSIQEIHKKLGVIPIKPYKSKTQVLNELGFPVISKAKARKINLLQHPDIRAIRN